jgi:hypothetical protein
VSNPPFVITPRAAEGVPTYEYRDGGRTGDAIVSDLVTSVGSVLAPGGVAQLLGNWEVRRGESWDERVGAWLDASGLDGWVVQRELQDPAQYAETWIRDGGTTPDRDPAAWRARYAAWLADFASRDVEGIGFGIVVLRRPARDVPPGARLRRLEEVTGTVRQPLGPAIGASLAAHDRLRHLDDAALAAERLTAAPDVTEERYLRPGDADPQVVLLRQGGGFGRTVQVGTALAGLVGACDGELAVGQIVGALAALLGVDGGALAAELLPEVRGLVQDGLLPPAAARRSPAAARRSPALRRPPLPRPGARARPRARLTGSPRSAPRTEIGRGDDRSRSGRPIWAVGCVHAVHPAQSAGPARAVLDVTGSSVHRAASTPRTPRARVPRATPCRTVDTWYLRATVSTSPGDVPGPRSCTPCSRLVSHAPRPRA